MAVYASVVERIYVEVAYEPVILPQAGLPPEGVRLLYLCDLHFRGHGWIEALKIQRILQLLRTEAYDFLLLGGDLLHSDGGIPRVLALVEALQPHMGVYAVPGNHDYTQYTVWGLLLPEWQEEWRQWSLAEWKRLLVTQFRQIALMMSNVLRNRVIRAPVSSNAIGTLLSGLSSQGVEILINRARPLPVGDGRLWIAGVDDLLEGHADVAAALQEVPDNAIVILLSHNPDVVLDPNAERASLVLAGHTHGGQVVLPGLGAVHTQGTHLKRKRPAGWFRRGAIRLFVSRGAGESVPLRFLARPQLVLLHLVPGQAREHAATVVPKADS